MKSHPGGTAHTRQMLELAKLPKGATVLDMGAGAGEALAILREHGCKARGIDLEPRDGAVEQGDFLHTSYPDECMDAVLSQCAFYLSADQTGALREAYRLLRSGGTLLLSDVFFEEPGTLLHDAGFKIIYAEDMTALWREYFLEALWRDESICRSLPRGRCEYWMIIGRKD